MFKTSVTGTFGGSLYTGTCGGLTLFPSSCSTSFTGTTGQSFVLTSGTTYYYRIWNTSTTAGGVIDLCIEQPLSCQTPTSIAVSSILTTSANVTWSAPPGGTPPTNYEYVVSTTNTTPSGAGTATGGATSASLSGLTPAT
ncbi:MAG: fibronectin type III domain-containing protein, partial [Pirellula sp.]|nr:fibronectin type III domain-containing protein [Pirellula sp.]